MATLSSSQPDEFPPDLIAAISDDAARDADRVGQFLHSCGLQGSRDRPLRLPGNILLDLGAALRLLAWEQNGIRVHVDAGLPPAGEVLRDVLQGVTDALTQPFSAAPCTLACRVMALFAERFSWHGRKELNADVTLDECTTKPFLEHSPISSGRIDPVNAPGRASTMARAKNRALLYARRSTDKQEISLPSQVEWAVAAARKYDVALDSRRLRPGAHQPCVCIVTRTSGSTTVSPGPT